MAERQRRGGGSEAAAGREASAGRTGARLGVALLGSTGSIGRSVVDVLARFPDRFRTVVLAAGRRVDVLAEQARRLRPAVVAAEVPLAGSDLPPGTRSVRADRQGLAELVLRPDVDLVVVGTAGLVSLRATIAALEAGKIVATSNKETLVAAGHLVMPLARKAAAEAAARSTGDPFASPLAWLRPIDSEHSAIWQCLAGEDRRGIRRLVLTASGGPFLDVPLAALATARPEAALRHPTWRMGPKITIDSATLVNKGLEVIEAHWLYDVDYDAIAVVIHPQSIVHSVVEFVDGSLKAQLGRPDMRHPIQYALSYPERWPAPGPSLDLAALARLDFRAPEPERFPALATAYEAGRLGPRATAALIAADEVAVERFLAGELELPGIARLLATAVERFGEGPVPADVEAVEALAAEVQAAFGGGGAPRGVVGQGAER
ncbi:MAG: 1-deoxy-D-xylulose 5-phosphate reductoisomerase [Chloroflexota bacterium]|nr:MAG: 1-deoxy-D-xylulose 5-phosphate reductoisomerase [Chloroflexota bacterium]